MSCKPYIIRFEPGNKEQFEQAAKILRGYPYRIDFSKYKNFHNEECRIKDWLLTIDEAWDIYYQSWMKINWYTELFLTENKNKKFLSQLDSYNKRYQQCFKRALEIYSEENWWTDKAPKHENLKNHNIKLYCHLTKIEKAHLNYFQVEINNTTLLHRDKEWILWLEESISFIERFEYLIDNYNELDTNWREIPWKIEPIKPGETRQFKLKSSNWVNLVEIDSISPNLDYKVWDWEDKTEEVRPTLGKDYFDFIEGAYLDPNFNTNNNETMSIYNKLQIEEFFGKKANIKRIKNALESTKTWKERFNTVATIWIRVKDKLDNLNRYLKDAVDNDEQDRVESLLSDIDEVLKYTDNLWEYDLFGIAAKFWPEEAPEFDAEKFLGL